MFVRNLILCSTLPLVLAACAPDPRAYETDPVEVQTSQGVVTCQLYTRNIVAWDRAIDRPDTMSVQQADQICKTEGQRQQS